MQNLSTINRFEHIEPEEPVVSTPRSTEGIFVVFVRVLDSEDTAPHGAHSEQRARIGPFLSEIKGIRRSNSQRRLTKLTDPGPIGHTICSHGHAAGLTSMQDV